jgi:hypothetical protein
MSDKSVFGGDWRTTIYRIGPVIRLDYRQCHYENLLRQTHKCRGVHPVSLCSITVKQKILSHLRTRIAQNDARAVSQAMVKMTLGRFWVINISELSISISSNIDTHD